ncbi:MAG: PIG-L deacetylase family protein [Sphingomonadaceae bacterium]
MEIGKVETPKVILVVGAHPDDTEFSSGGSLLRWTQQGCTVHYLVCTNGDKGTKDLDMTAEQLVPIRQEEQREAARRLGVASVTFLGGPDGEFLADLSNREKITRIIRKVRPDVLMVHDPWRRYQLHPDHRAVGICTLDAMVAARDHLYFPHLFHEGLMPHTVPEILLFGTDEANVWVDTSSTIEGKLYALKAHESQVSRIPDLKERIYDWARRVGRAHGLELAEEFHRIEQR